MISWFILITVLLLGGYVMLLMYYRKGWNRLPDFKVALEEIEKPVFISVIVPARNEEHNIGVLIN